jgi:chromosome partitioning protein
MTMKTILVINSKGGCGKTTLTTNLASYYASHNLQAAIMDYDPQGSSLNWIRSRSATLPRIHGANAAPARSNRMRSVEMYVHPSTQVLLIDPPAGATGLLLQDLVQKADFILIPVAPSTIDIHASAHFVKELFLSGGVRRLNKKLAVVANKVRSSMPIYEPLERFLRSLNLPLLTRISDSDNYLKAVESGFGIFELDIPGTTAQRREFMPVIEWLDIDKDRVDLEESNIFAFGSARRIY